MSFRDADRQAGYAFRPGQFNMLTVFGVGEAPISISSSAREKGRFAHTVRIVGNVTNALARLEPGQSLGVRGPYGRGWPMDLLQGSNILIVAGGIGLAPLRPVIEEVCQNRDAYGHLEILYGARSPGDQIFTADYPRWSSIPGVTLRLAVDTVPAGGDSPPWRGAVGPVTTLFGVMESVPENTVVLTCGPEIMMRFVVKDLLERGFREEQIYLSLERRMECGVSKCGHCLIGPIYVCKDGPVFNYWEIKDLPEAVF